MAHHVPHATGQLGLSSDDARAALRARVLELVARDAAADDAAARDDDDDGDDGDGDDDVARATQSAARALKAAGLLSPAAAAAARARARRRARGAADGAPAGDARLSLIHI